MTNRPNLRISASEIDELMSMLEINDVRLTEWRIEAGHQLTFPPSRTPAIHYNLFGTGQMTIGDAPTIALAPHTLVIAPPRQALRIDVAAEPGSIFGQRVVEAPPESAETPGTRRRSVGGGQPRLIMICGQFRATYGTIIDLFRALPVPIVERFAESDQLHRALTAALDELATQQVGVGAMTAAMLRQIMVMLVRRSLAPVELWLERFSELSDPQVARALAEMVGRPGAAHSLSTLSQTAALSRSAFMVRFGDAFGCSPMVVLRQLRMRRASHLLAAHILSIEQVAHAVGYASRTSFARAFRQTYGIDPSEYSARTVQPSRGGFERVVRERFQALA
ncbi:MAG: AraC family transcriptional regulator [Parafilimonas terrae]|nr:AraC family transcriptional regulator [Parafilimonas terrae]